MRRVYAILLLCSSIALAGAARPAAKPTPTPAPTAMPTAPPRHAMPIVVVYPFDVSTALQADTGIKAGHVFVEQMNAAGGVDAIDAPQSVKRPQYLQYAKSIDADYYVAGYMTPLGTGVSLVEQVVSAQTGTIVFGHTAQIESLEDATAQAVFIRDGIVQREASIEQAVAASSSQSTPTPMPGNEANLSHLAGGLFKHRGKATPTPRPTPAVKPSKGVLVVKVNGSGSDLTKATSDLYNALNSYYNVRLIDHAGNNLAKEADGICGTQRNNTIATGALSSKSVKHGWGHRTEYDFTLQVYTCFGAKLGEASGTGDSVTNAIGAAVNAYAKDHPQNG